jgi:predicted regulator of amino acid metabolism with ACT domain
MTNAQLAAFLNELAGELPTMSFDDETRRQVRRAAQRLEAKEEISEAVEALKALDTVLDFSTPMKGQIVLIEIEDPSAFNAAAEKARAALEAAAAARE